MRRSVFERNSIHFIYIFSSNGLPNCCQLVSNWDQSHSWDSGAKCQHVPWFIIYLLPRKDMSLFVFSVVFLPKFCGKFSWITENKRSFNHPWWKSPHIKSCVSILTTFPFPRFRTIRLQHLRWGQSDKDPVGPSWKGGNSTFVSLKRTAPLKGRPIFWAIVFQIGAKLWGQSVHIGHFNTSTSDQICCHCPHWSNPWQVLERSKSPRDERDSKEALQHQVCDLNSNVTRDEISQNRFI